MSLYGVGNSDLTRNWAASLTVPAVSDARYNAGYINGDRPPASEHNAIYKELGQKVNHSLQHGVAEWSTAKAYAVGNACKRNGRIYIALTVNTASEPTSANPDWEQVLGVNGLIELMPFPIGQPPRTTSSTQVQLPAGLLVNDSAGARMPTNPSVLTASINTTGVNGLDVGTKAAGSWYWLYYIAGASGQGLLLSLNASTPELPDGYTRFKNLKTPFRTNSSSNLMFMDYDGFGSGVHTGIYTRPEYDALGASVATGANVFLSGGASASFVNVGIPQAPFGALQAHIAYASRTGTTKFRPSTSPFTENGTFAPTSVDNIHNTWIDLDETQQVQYKVAGSATTAICDGFRLPAV